MIRQHVLTSAVAVLLLVGLGGAGGYWLALNGPMLPGLATEADPSEPSQEGRKVLYWYDPMYPQHRFDKPGKSPFMDMALVPKYADEADNATVHIDPVLQQNTGIRLAEVKTGHLVTGIETVGSLTFNERDIARVQARTSGIVERVYNHAPNDVIVAGAPLADLRVLEWYGAQAEYLALKQSGEAGLATAARARLAQLGMRESQINRLDRTGQSQAVVTITAPRSGMIAELGIREGMMVSPGQTLAQINGIDTVWLDVEVPEVQAAGIRTGAQTVVYLAAWPETQFTGQVTALLPELNRAVRTVRVRVELPNRDGRLRPGMYAQVQIREAEGRETLIVPLEAVIATGKRSVVIVAEGNGRYLPAEVKTGRERDGKTEILAGLKAGETVVTSGQFLIDSEASLKGVLARMASDPLKTKDTPPHEAQGKVEAISASEVTLSHGPVPSLEWPAMTMPFKLGDAGLAQGIKPGDTVKFTFHQGDDSFVVEHIEKVGGEE